LSSSESENDFVRAVRPLRPGPVTKRLHGTERPAGKMPHGQSEAYLGYPNGQTDFAPANIRPWLQTGHGVAPLLRIT
jgi:hypothetical protein